MYTVAVIGDILGFVPFINDIAVAIASFLLWLIASPEENIFSKDIELTLGMIAIEAVPGPSVLPTLTLRVWWAKRRAKKIRETIAAAAASR